MALKLSKFKFAHVKLFFCQPLQILGHICNKRSCVICLFHLLAMLLISMFANASFFSFSDLIGRETSDKSALFEFLFLYIKKNSVMKSDIQTKVNIKSHNNNKRRLA